MSTSRLLITYWQFPVFSSQFFRLILLYYALYLCKIMMSFFTDTYKIYLYAQIYAILDKTHGIRIYIKMQLAT